ncbi:MAG: hypothetical protein ACXV4B_08610 [Halobacteriota archaeon]
MHDFRIECGVMKIPTDTNMRGTATPSALLAALYAEYDGLLDTLESLQLQFKSQGRLNMMKRNELRRKLHAICEKLADVHEQMAIFDFVAR